MMNWRNGNRRRGGDFLLDRRRLDFLDVTFDQLAAFPGVEKSRMSENSTTFSLGQAESKMACKEKKHPQEACGIIFASSIRTEGEIDAVLDTISFTSSQIDEFSCGETGIHMGCQIVLTYYPKINNGIS